MFGLRRAGPLAAVQAVALTGSVDRGWDRHVGLQAGEGGRRGRRRSRNRLHDLQAPLLTALQARHPGGHHQASDASTPGGQRGAVLAHGRGQAHRGRLHH